MKVAVWTSEQYGPAFAAMVRTKVGPPDTASIPHCPPGPGRQWAGKGHDVNWREWANHLSGRLPYGGQWSVQDVPDGSIHDALSYLRQQSTEQGLTQAKPPGRV